MMFSDKYRLVKIVIIVFAIFLICWYSWVKGPQTELPLATYLANPDAFDGAKVLIRKHETKSGQVFKDRFEIIQLGNKITVYGSPGDLSPNEYVTVKGIFHKEGYLTLEEMHVHKGRRIKIVVSVLPVLIVAGLLYRKYRFDLKKMMFFRRA